MKYLFFAFIGALLQFPLIGQAKMTDKQIYAVSMENDAQFIECVGNIFLGVANFQRVILEDLKWDSSNPEFQKIDKTKKSFQKASENLDSAVKNSDLLLKELSDEKKKKFEMQLNGFKNQVKDLNKNLISIISGIDRHQLPKTDEVHQIITKAIAGTGFGMNVSKKNSEKKSEL
ncbi:hypothetical protein [Bdellovibrio sp. GT3]|uniref:hypothetical protein n=1 Tax=Bdellovibrio sp. GT3 TaxID=3136282 RepID=UPI0030F35F68